MGQSLGVDHGAMGSMNPGQRTGSATLLTFDQVGSSVP
jgi:hypothetical protein